jgi:hypothetical protein
MNTNFNNLHGDGGSRRRAHVSTELPTCTPPLIVTAASLFKSYLHR